MSRYKVAVTRDTTETAFVTVIAESLVDAKAKGVRYGKEAETIGSGIKPLEYERDECATSGPYITCCEKVSQTADELKEAFGMWGEHDGFPVSDWVLDVRDEGTRIGYWEWVVDQVEAREFEEETR